MTHIFFFFEENPKEAKTNAKDGSDSQTPVVSAFLLMMNSLEKTSLDSNTSADNSLLQSAQFLYLLDFINSSRAGSAQKEFGIPFQAFITSLTLTLIYFIGQVCLFGLIRGHFKCIYQPNCYYVPDDEKVPPLSDNFFSWLTHVVMNPLEEYKRMGLDAYLFLRYISFLLVMFVGLAICNIPILLPINYNSGYDKYTEADRLSFTNGPITIVKGLDRLSMSNISPKFSNRMSIHLTMAVLTIIWFHALVIYELLTYVKIRNNWIVNHKDYLNSKLPERDHSNTILIDNVPAKMLNREVLNSFFSRICGAKIKNIWLVYKYRDIKTLYKEHLKLLDRIEYLETALILQKLNSVKQESKFGSVQQQAGRNDIKSWIRNLQNYRITMIYYVIPVIKFNKIQEQLVPLTSEYLQNNFTLQNKKCRLVQREAGPMKDHKLNKVFVQFDDSLHPDILDQIQIGGKLNLLNRTLIRLNPKDVIWENLTVESNMLVFVRLVIGNSLGCLVILLWVIPVSFVSMISQVPYISRLVPILAWMILLPDYITDVISNLLSVVFLLALMEMAPFVMRFIAYLKCKRTGAEVELDVQKWMFVFSFIHVFLVVTITSGFTVILETLFHNPVSIPDLLAANLPKCANFFFSYMMIRGVSFFGNNLLQTFRLVQNMVIFPFIDTTPRRKFQRYATVPVYKWGSLYSSFALLACIGLIYSIVSPLILVFITISFVLALISFKYSIEFQFNHKNYSETYGQFYPKAIFHLYTGIYFLEICLIGMFASSRDENGESNCLQHALVTLGLFLITATLNFQLKRMFGNLLRRNLPLTMHLKDHEPLLENLEGKKRNEIEPIPLKENTLFNDTFYQPCFQHNNSSIWIPKDQYGISDREIEYLKNLGIECSNDYCDLNNYGQFDLQNCPPDYVDW